MSKSTHTPWTSQWFIQKPYQCNYDPEESHLDIPTSPILCKFADHHYIFMEDFDVYMTVMEELKQQ